MDKSHHFHFLPAAHALSNISTRDLGLFNRRMGAMLSEATHAALLKCDSQTIAITPVHWKKTDLLLKFVEVSPRHRGNAIAEMFLEAIFDKAADIAHAEKSKIWLTYDDFTVEGRRLLLPRAKKLSLKYPDVSFDLRPAG